MRIPKEPYEWIIFCIGILIMLAMYIFNSLSEPKPTPPKPVPRIEAKAIRLLSADNSLVIPTE